MTTEQPPAPSADSTTDPVEDRPAEAVPAQHTPAGEKLTSPSPAPRSGSEPGSEPAAKVGVAGSDDAAGGVASAGGAARAGTDGTGGDDAGPGAAAAATGEAGSRRAAASTADATGSSEADSPRTATPASGATGNSEADSSEAATLAPDATGSPRTATPATGATGSPGAVPSVADAASSRDAAADAVGRTTEAEPAVGTRGGAVTTAEAGPGGPGSVPSASVPADANAQTVEGPATKGAAFDTTTHETKPAETKPAETTPGESKPAETTPDENKPGETKPGDGAAAGTAGLATAGAGAGAPPGEEKPADPWAAFGPAPVRMPGRIGRIGRRIGQFIIHEWTLAALGALALAVLMTWPTLRYPAYTIPQDTWDPTLQAWQMAWSGHILTSDPAQLWQANTFFPERYSFAFSDTLLGYAPAGMIGHGFTAAIVRYNILYVLLHALAFFGAYALVRQLGSGRTGAAVAAVAFAYAPWRLAQNGHLHVISTGGIALALAMLARGHGWSLRHGYRPERRNAWWALAGWLVAMWQLSLGFGIGLPFAYVLAGIGAVAVVTWFVRSRWFWAVKRPFGRALLGANLLGGLLFGAVGALLAVPYFKVAQDHPNAKRTVDDLRAYSAPLRGLFTAPPESRLWGGLHADARAALPWHPEMTLLPGFALYGLAIAGLFFSVWKLWHRLLLLAGVLVTMALAMGTQFFGGKIGYLALYQTLPGWDGLRTPGRLVLWTTLLLGILAAGAVGAFVTRATEFSADRVPARPGPLLRLATLIPLALVLAEGLNATPHPVVPVQPSAMRTVAGPLLVLPSNERDDMHVMLWSVNRFQPVVNGGSGFLPTRQEEIRKAAQAFPDPVSVDYLRKQGVKAVIVLRREANGTPWQVALGASVDALGIQREETADAVIFRL